MSKAEMQFPSFEEVRQSQLRLVVRAQRPGVRFAPGKFVAIGMTQPGEGFHERAKHFAREEALKARAK
jgi:hypothetical protein